MLFLAVCSTIHIGWMKRLGKEKRAVFFLFLFVALSSFLDSVFSIEGAVIRATHCSFDPSFSLMTDSLASFLYDFCPCLVLVYLMLCGMPNVVV